MYRVGLASVAGLAVVASAFIAGASIDEGTSVPAAEAVPAEDMVPFTVETGETMFLVQAHGADVTVSHARGLQKIRYDSGEVLEREVEIWQSDDGRYRARVTSLDGGGASEEVAYDGHGHQLVLITDRGGGQDAFVVEGSEHFAITGARDATESREGGVIVESHVDAEHGSVHYETSGAVERLVVDASALEVLIPPGVVVRDGADFTPVTQEVVPTATEASSAQWQSLYGGWCAYGYNYRNSSSNFFTANTQKRSACAHFDVSTWGYSSPGQSTCVYAYWGGGPTHSSYSSWTGYKEVVSSPSWARHACSNHAAWDSAWVLHVPWRAIVVDIKG